MNEFIKANTTVFFHHEALCSGVGLRSLNYYYSVRNQGVSKFKWEEILFNLFCVMSALFSTDFSGIGIWRINVFLEEF